MKKLFLGLAAVALLAGCSNGGTTENEGGEAKYNAGKYTAVAKGNNGDVTVEVEFDAEKIVSVTVTDHAETAGLSDAPIADIPAAIVEANGTEGVETVSGATNTSNAIITAVNDAMNQAAKQFNNL